MNGEVRVAVEVVVFVLDIADEVFVVIGVRVGNGCVLFHDKGGKYQLCN